MEIMDMRYVMPGVMGFAAGLAWGYRGYFDEKQMSLDIAVNGVPRDSVPGKLMTESIISKGKLEELNKMSKRISYSMPLALGATCSLVDSLVTRNPIAEELAVAVPAAYAGHFIGSASRWVKTRGIRNEIKILKKLSENPECAPEYMTKEQREIFKGTIENLERMILESEEPDAEELITESEKIRVSLLTPGKVYTPYLMRWGVEELKRVTGKAFQVRELRDFYGDSMPEGKDTRSAIVGIPDSLNLRVFNRKGRFLYVQKASWPQINMVEIDGKGTLVEGLPANLTEESREDWNPDYKAMVDRINVAKKSGSVMVMRTPEESPADFDSMVVTKTFIPAYTSYQIQLNERERKEKKKQEGKEKRKKEN